MRSKLARTLEETRFRARVLGYRLFVAPDDERMLFHLTEFAGSHGAPLLA